MLKANNTGTVVVGVAGPSGSGKTAFSEKIKGLMPGVAIISMDMYNDGTKVIDDNFDDPRLTDYDTLLRNLTDLRDGKEVQIPIYDFRTSRRVGYRAQPVPEARVVLVEGIYALSERLRPLMDLRVSITGGVHFDLVKRVMRDISRSGQGPEEIVQQITDTVYPMYKAFIEPDLQTAHLRIVNSFNPFSGFMNATYILKSKKVPDIDTVIKVLESYHGGVPVASTPLSASAPIHITHPVPIPPPAGGASRQASRTGSLHGNGGLLSVQLGGGGGGGGAGGPATPGSGRHEGSNSVSPAT
eukprot:XP_001693065.1 predicted protein [Chlamydomonas reinhardtii]